MGVTRSTESTVTESVRPAHGTPPDPGYGPERQRGADCFRSRTPRPAPGTGQSPPRYATRCTAATAAAAQQFGSSRPDRASGFSHLVSRPRRGLEPAAHQAALGDDALLSRRDLRDLNSEPRTARTRNRSNSELPDHKVCDKVSDSSSHAADAVRPP